ncbi:hypothetical protein [Bradyrhizobium sp. Ash2021]|uniref:hypothetical protein n=1 Tax=Bradyrhizobium sp. Ash2021 TaxID=2954771 RepID=UPI002815E6E2|nr:hypothetical protein [Bradyrhizobium sp. Ash2021]WMT78832.1 hypothetical protein NL528_21900 [Bradyrhizobium sp. Ash2021]
MTQPKHLRRWTMPANYFGAVWPAYYSSGVGQSRDSDALERSNFECMLKALGGETETVVVVRELHWAVGWVEWIAIHQDDEKALKIADDITGKLKRSTLSKKKPTQPRRTATTRKSGSNTPADAASAPLVSGHDPVADR